MDQRVDDERHRHAAPARDAEPAPRAADQQASWLTRLREHRTLALTITALLILVAVGVVIWWISTSGSISTDDAFVDARTVTVSSQVSAQVIEVPVTDNVLVQAGAVLARLDSRDYQAQVDQAKAQVDAAQANTANVDAQVTAQQARIEQADRQVAQAQAALTFAKEQNDRYQSLLKSGSVTVEQAQQFRSNFLQAQATFAAAEANAQATQKQLLVLQSQVLQARAQSEQMQASLEQAETNLSRTVITAPVDGYIAQLTAAKGDNATVGQALMMFVPREVWITANFKETELSSLRIGAPATIVIDAFPKRTFKGHVASIQPGSGTAFSLLPPENATGNYVKIVQRVPVKIVFDEQPDVLLGPGMSAVPTVMVQ